MLKPLYAKQFAKDIKRLQKRGKALKKIKKIIEQLINEVSLSVRCRDHKLIGNYKGRRECHIEADWLLIYKVKAPEIIFERTGSHSDLFE